MSWDSSNRRAQLPPNWKDLVKEVWARDKGQCRWRLPSGKRCPRPGADVDHRYSPNRHKLEDLWLLCRTHHDQKTAKEAQAGRRRKRPPGRPEEQHPGLRRT